MIMSDDVFAAFEEGQDYAQLLQEYREPFPESLMALTPDNALVQEMGFTDKEWLAYCDGVRSAWV